MSDFQFRCPKCGSTHLNVAVTAVVQLLQDNDCLQTYDGDASSDHEWDTNSPMFCAACDHKATAGEFATDKAEQS